MIAQTGRFKVYRAIMTRQAKKVNYLAEYRVGCGVNALSDLKTCTLALRRPDKTRQRRIWLCPRMPTKPAR